MSRFSTFSVVLYLMLCVVFHSAYAQPISFLRANVDMTARTLVPDSIYVIVGDSRNPDTIKVTSTLTIQAGVKILCDTSTLVNQTNSLRKKKVILISDGGSIHANGTSSSPILFNGIIDSRRYAHMIQFNFDHPHASSWLQHCYIYSHDSLNVYPSTFDSNIVIRVKANLDTAILHLNNCSINYPDDYLIYPNLNNLPSAKTLILLDSTKNVVIDSCSFFGNNGPYTPGDQTVAIHSTTSRNALISNSQFLSCNVMCSGDRSGQFLLNSISNPEYIVTYPLVLANSQLMTITENNIANFDSFGISIVHCDSIFMSFDSIVTAPSDITSLVGVFIDSSQHCYDSSSFVAFVQQDGWSVNRTNSSRFSNCYATCCSQADYGDSTNGYAGFHFRMVHNLLIDSCTSTCNGHGYSPESHKPSNGYGWGMIFFCDTVNNAQHDTLTPNDNTFFSVAVSRSYIYKNPNASADVSINCDSGVVLQGLKGGGIWVQNHSRISIDTCHIRYNAIGIKVSTGASPLVRDCLIDSNFMLHRIPGNDGKTTIQSSPGLFFDNHPYGSYLRNRIYNNSIGIVALGGDSYSNPDSLTNCNLPWVWNCVIDRSELSGVTSRSGGIRLSNSILYHNYLSADMLADSAHATVLIDTPTVANQFVTDNCVYVRNRNGEFDLKCLGGVNQFQVRYTYYQQKDNLHFNQIPGGTGARISSPEFMNPLCWNWHDFVLTANSPGIDQGDSLTFFHDLYPETNNPRNDLGCCGGPNAKLNCGGPSDIVGGSPFITVISGQITHDTTITRDVHVNGDLFIYNNARLTILSGVHVFLDQGHSVTVKGGIICNGSTYGKIFFDVYHLNDWSGEYWQGIIFSGNFDAQHSIFGHVVIRHALTGMEFDWLSGPYGISPNFVTISDGEMGVVVYGSYVSMKSDTIRNMIFHGCQIYNGAFDLTNSCIENCGGYGLYIYVCNPLLMNNVIRNNGSLGFPGVYCLGASPDIRKSGSSVNIFMNNGPTTGSPYNQAELLLTGESYPLMKESHADIYDKRTPGQPYDCRFAVFNNSAKISVCNNYFGSDVQTVTDEKNHTTYDTLVNWGVPDTLPNRILDVNELMNALALKDSGRFIEAIPIFQSIISEYADSADGYFAIGQLCECWNQTGLSQDSLRQWLLTESILHSSAYRRVLERNASWCLDYTRSYDSALREFDSARVQAPRLTDSVVAVLNIELTNILRGMRSGGNTTQSLGNSSERLETYREHVLQLTQLINQRSYQSMHKQDPTLPTEFSLAKPYPNPFNSTTRIKFSVPVNHHVVLEVYDRLGREVATIANKDFQAGKYLIDWDGKNSSGQKVSSGVYFIHMNAGMFSATQKSVMVK